MSTPSNRSGARNAMSSEIRRSVTSERPGTPPANPDAEPDSDDNTSGSSD